MDTPPLRYSNARSFSYRHRLYKQFGISTSAEFDYTEGTATEPEDFNSIVTTIGFPTATTSLSFSISIVPDTIVEKDHSFTISLSNVIIPVDVDQNCISFTGSQVVTILDDDTDVALSDGTAVETSDYTTNDGTFSFDINTNDLSFEVGIVDDSNVENHQSFTVGVSMVNFPEGFDNTAATTCSLDPALHDVDESQSGTITIVCDNQVDDEGVSLTNKNKTLLFTDLCFTDGTAEDGVDYVSTDPFPFPTGTTTFSVELEIVDDTIIEGDETFDVEICDFSFEPGFSATTAFEVTGSAQCQIDDDDFADCSFTPVSQCLFEEDGFFTISIACSKATDVAGFEIGIQGFELDAESTSDYVVPSPRIEIPVETLEFTTLIEIVDDNEQEEDEEFYVMFGSTFQPERFPRMSVFSLLPPVTFTLTIKDNDVATTQSPLTTMGSTAPSEETTQATTEQTTTSKPEQPTTDQTTDQTTPADYHTQEQQDRNLPFEPQPCQLECLGQHMECMAVEGIATCNCTEGYELVNAEVCQDQNECALSPCSGGVYEMCINTDGSYFCECNAGYGEEHQWRLRRSDQIFRLTPLCSHKHYLFTKVALIHNDECLVSPCLDYQDCVNLDGGFSCVCRDGFLTSADDICVDIDECSTGVDDCHLFTNTLCKNTIGHFVCACVDGFVRNPSGACSLLEECEPDFKETCQFPEEFCYVNELRENFCGCSPGYDRLSPSSQCENRDECLDVPDVCRSVENSHCVDEIPSVDDPNRFYVCECTEGYREIVTGICMKEIQLRLGMVITEVNNERALNLWSEELTDTDSQRFQQFSEFLCSFFHESVLSSPDVNQTTCRGLGFAEDATGMYVALELTVVPTSNGEAATADKIKESLLQDANFEGEGVYIWEKSNRDSITVQTTSMDVQALEDIGCARSLCQNGGTCVFDENVYRTACSRFQSAGRNNRPIEYRTAHRCDDRCLHFRIGYDWSLLPTVEKPKQRRRSKTICCLTEVPLRLTARPLGIRDPSVVRNPLANRHLKPGSHTNDDDDYDDLRMRRLETSFVKMGSPRSNASHSTSDSDDDGSSTTSPEFTLPYAADGSVNV
ncbi:hypothetical protein BSL78_05808 [Apostichopus japonicus]|uniref:EGF-like domain-containing protein n=1 Tax=Stichopus japonicus TaxID=307972 RepID=A0A2G8LAW5_STIJA|nr:hypothetical protein BSL78_05808 [Apostichopus japonicus]